MFGQLNCYIGQQSGVFVVICPSINTTGFGDSAEDAWNDFKYNVNVLIEKLAIFSKEELIVTEPFDEKQLLREFDLPGQVTKMTIEL